MKALIFSMGSMVSTGSDESRRIENRGSAVITMARSANEKDE